MNFIDIVNANPEVVEQVAETAENLGVLGSLGINLNLFIFQLINFAIVVAILWFLILKPLVKKLGEREKMIDESIKNSEKLQKTLDKSEKDYQGRMDKAKVEANKILEKTNAEAIAMGEEMKIKAKKDIEELVLHARKNIKLEKEEMVAGIKRETAEILAVAIEKILGEKIDIKKDKELIEKALKEIK